MNKELARMFKGGVIMDVTTPEQAKIAEDARDRAVMGIHGKFLKINGTYILKQTIKRHQPTPFGGSRCPCLRRRYFATRPIYVFILSRERGL